MGRPHEEETLADHGFWTHANKNPGRTALVDPERREWTAGELHAAANQVVHGLRELGLEYGDSVAICMPNCAEYFQVYLAVTQAGWYLTPINWHLAPSEIAYIVQDCDAKAFFGHARVGDACRKAADEIGFPAEASFAVGETPGFRRFGELLAGQSEAPPPDRAPGQVMNYTSGTTGKPKGVRRALAPRELEPDVMGELLAGFLGMFGVQPENDNVYLCGSPLYHTAVLLQAASSMHWGHTLVLMDKWTPEGMLERIDRYRVTLSHMVPTQFHRLLLLPEDERARYDCSSTRHMLHAAAPCPPDVKRRMLDWWGDAIWEYYAATEGGGTIVSPQEWRKYPGTVGRPWPGADVKIVDDDGRAVPTGEQGTVYMLLPEQMTFEYKGDSAKTNKSRIMLDGQTYFTVGDVGYLDEDGYLFLCDRKIDMIISGGANIYPAEIENVLLTHPGVGDVAVFGIPHEDWGEEVKAVVEPAPGVEAGEDFRADIFEFCRDRLARFKMPRTIDFVDTLPRDPNGKLYKRKLRDPYWVGHERAI